MNFACLAGFDAVCLSECHFTRISRVFVPLELLKVVGKRASGVPDAQVERLERLAKDSVESRAMTSYIVESDMRQKAKYMQTIEEYVGRSTLKAFLGLYRGPWPVPGQDEGSLGTSTVMEDTFLQEEEEDEFPDESDWPSPPQATYSNLVKPKPPVKLRRQSGRFQTPGP